MVLSTARSVKVSGHPRRLCRDAEIGAAPRVVELPNVVATATVCNKRATAAADSTVQSAPCLRHAPRLACSTATEPVVRVAFAIGWECVAPRES